MRGEVYDALIARVNGALDYEVRWQPNEYEPDGFVEHVRPLELTDGVLVTSGCSQCGVQLLANHFDEYGMFMAAYGLERSLEGAAS